MSYGQEGQPYLSEKWDVSGGKMTMFYRNATLTDQYNNVYVAGATLNQNGYHDILIQKFDLEGILLWEQTYNGAANMDDLAADIFLDDENSLYVTGTSVENIYNDHDLIVLKYNVNGELAWSSVYNNGGKDAGTAITVDNNGNI